MKTIHLLSAISIVALSGCAATGQQYRADVYSVAQVNSKQEAKTIKILAVMPAKVQVENKEGKQRAQMVGGLLGAVAGVALSDKAANRYKRPKTLNGALGGALGGGVIGAASGSLVADHVLVEGVSLTYVEGEKTLNSAQVGRSCEYKAGMAIMVVTSPTETRIQPNTTCPATEKS